jgi:hypothetical protein
VALDLGIQLVSSYYQAIRDNDRFCWTMHVCAPYLDRPDSSWFDSGLPAVGYFHDYEPVTEGTGWMTRWLDRWQDAGARRFIDFREVNSALGLRLALEENGGELKLVVERSAGCPDAIRPVQVQIKASGPLPRRLAVEFLDGPVVSADIRGGEGGIGLVGLPARAADRL